MNYRWLIVVIVVGAMGGCFVPQTYDTIQYRSISLNIQDLQEKGMAFITPSTITGQEEEKQALALTFAAVLRKERPRLRCITLPETLNAVNKAGLADDYKHMFADYRDTGIFNRDILQKISSATNTGYVAQLKLMTFVQNSNDRFGFLGLRLVVTKSAHLRLFFQIWNAESGSIAWEGVQEMHYAVDTMSESSVTLRTAIEKAARDLIEQLPQPPKGGPGEALETRVPVSSDSSSEQSVVVR